MFIYFLEQVWAYDQILVNETQLVQLSFWDQWHETPFKERPVVYPYCWMEEDVDWIEY